MKNIISVILITFILSSCTSTRIVGIHTNPSQADTLNYSEVQKSIQKKEVSLLFKDGQVIEAIVTQVTPDSIYFVSGNNKNINVISTLALNRIEKNDQLGGTIAGIFNGTLIGTFLGGGIAYATVSGNNSASEGAGFVILFGIVGGASVGAIGGGLYGYGHGNIKVYQFQNESKQLVGSDSTKSSTP